MDRARCATATASRSVAGGGSTRCRSKRSSALAAWVDRYDSGEWDDPPGKLSLLYEIERVAGLLRSGNEPFHPDRDRRQFEAFLIDVHGCRPTPGASR